MRKLTWLLVVVLVSLFAVNAFAAGTTVIGVNGGVLKGTGDFGDATKTGFGGGVFADYWLNSMFAAGVDFGWNTVKSKDDGEQADVVFPGTGATGTVDSKFTIMNYGAHAKYMLPMGEMPAHVYLLGGLGAYNLKNDVSVTGYAAASASDTKFGGRGGLGLEYMMTSQFGIGAEGDFHVITTDKKSTQMFTGVGMLTWHMVPMAK